MASEAMPDCRPSPWADLHPPLLDLILRRLPLPEYIGFAAVCRQWLEVWQGCRRTPPRPRLPWLLLHTMPNEEASTPVLYNPDDLKAYHLRKSPDPPIRCRNGVLCQASSRGWLLVAGCSSPGDMEYKFFDETFLLHLLSGSRVQLPRRRFMWRYNESRCVVLSSAPSEPDCTVLVVHWDEATFCRPGDERWSALPKADIGRDCFLLHAAFCNGMFYALSRERNLVAFDHRREETWRLSMQLQLPNGFYPSVFEDYLVESEGELLMVSFNVVRESVPWEWYSSHAHVLVFRADFASMAWERVEDLGDRVLFVGVGGSGSVSGSGAGGPMGRVYRALDHRRQWCWIEFDMKDGSVACHPDPTGTIRSAYRRSIWVTPCLQ